MPRGSPPKLTRVIAACTVGPVAQKALHRDWYTVAEVAAIVHSHPGYSANPSMADRAQCEASGLPWVIVGLPSGHLVELAPSGWSAPLEGREFHFGVLDCYTLVQDWYHRTWGLVLPDFERADGFWERGEHLYRNGLAEAGFVVSPTREPQVGDGLLMRVNSPEVDNHAAVYLGEGMMLHHLWGQPSRVERWDWPWQRRTTAIVRQRCSTSRSVLMVSGVRLMGAVYALAALTERDGAAIPSGPARPDQDLYFTLQP